MKFYIQISLLSFLLFTAFLLTSCTKETSDYTKIEPAHLERIKGSDVEKITLTEKAAERIGIKVSTISSDLNPGTSEEKKVVPYSAVLYDIEGKTWVYTNPSNLVFIRKKIVVDQIKGERAFLNDGPAEGTSIVVQGAAELLGPEFHVGH